MKAQGAGGSWGETGIGGVAEVVGFPVYVDRYGDEKSSLQFANIACERYLAFGANLHGTLNLAAQCRVMCEDGHREIGAEKLEGKEKWGLRNCHSREARAHRCAWKITRGAEHVSCQGVKDYKLSN